MSIPVTADAPEAQLPVHDPDRPADRRDLRFAANIFRGLFFLALVVMLAAVVGAGMYALAHSNRIYEGVTIGGHGIGGMTRSEARAALRDDLRAATSQPVILVNGDQQFSLDPRASGIEVDMDATVDAAFAYGREG